jgi:hypothetical protein
VSRREKLIEAATPYVDEGEQIRHIVSGQTGAPHGPLGSIAIVAGKAKQRRVVATDRKIYVLEGDFWGTAKSKGLVAKYELGEVAVERGRMSMTVGGEQIFIHGFAQGDADEIAATAAAARAASAR